MESKIISDKDKRMWIRDAINHPVGHITQALIYFTANKEEKDKPKYCKYFKELLEVVKEKFCSTYVNTILINNLGVLYKISPKWTIENVIPLLSWADKEEKALFQYWISFLLGFTSEDFLSHEDLLFHVAKQNYILFVIKKIDFLADKNAQRQLIHLSLEMFKKKYIKFRELSPLLVQKSYCQMLCMEKIRQHIFSHLSCYY